MYQLNNPSSDSSKVGQRMLEKMGWSEGKGLGANESGETSHIKTNKRSLHLGNLNCYNSLI